MLLQIVAGLSIFLMNMRYSSSISSASEKVIQAIQQQLY